MSVPHLHLANVVRADRGRRRQHQPGQRATGHLGVRQAEEARELPMQRRVRVRQWHQQRGGGRAVALRRSARRVSALRVCRVPRNNPPPP